MQRSLPLAPILSFLHQIFPDMLSFSLCVSIVFRSDPCFHPVSVSSPVLSLSALLGFFSFYPQRVSVSLGWRLKHLLNFIAVSVGFSSSEVRGTIDCVCVCVSLVHACFFSVWNHYCLNSWACISCACVQTYIYYIDILYLYMCIVCLMVWGVRIGNTTTEALNFTLLSFSFINIPWGRTHWKLLWFYYLIFFLQWLQWFPV